VFSFQDDDEQWLSLRYDLTAPLARYVAENFDALPKPYRSYRFGWVFRNEKPGPGRFRQFMQFDADTVGSASSAADAEMCMMAADTMEALGVPRGSYVVKVNNRKVLDGVMGAVGLAGEDHAEKRLAVLRAIDKLDRLGIDGVELLLGPGRKEMQAGAIRLEYAMHFCECRFKVFDVLEDGIRVQKIERVVRERQTIGAIRFADRPQPLVWRADMYIRTEATRSLVFQIAANSNSYRIDPALAAAVKAKASDDALFVTQACIQLHGGIGFTDEHEIGLYLKRAMLLSSLFGNAAAQRRRYVTLAELAV